MNANKRGFYLLILLISVTMAGWGCYYDVEEELYPNGCNTTNVSYSENVARIFETYACIGCHQGTTPDGGVSLEGYENVKIYVDNGKLLGSILPEEGFELMPLGGPRMKDCDIARIQSWIDAGAPDN